MKNINSEIQERQLKVTPINLTYRKFGCEFRLETEVDPLFITTRLHFLKYGPEWQTRWVEDEKFTYITIAISHLATCDSLYKEIEAQHNLAFAKIEKLEHCTQLRNGEPTILYHLIKGMTYEEERTAKCQALATKEVLSSALEHGQYVFGREWEHSEISCNDGVYAAIIRTTLGEIHMKFETLGNPLEVDKPCRWNLKEAQIHNASLNQCVVTLDEEAIAEVNKEFINVMPRMLKWFIQTTAQKAEKA